MEKAPVTYDDLTVIENDRYTKQAFLLLDMQQVQVQELSAKGVILRALLALPETKRDKIENANANNRGITIYRSIRSIMPDEAPDKDVVTFGIRFSIKGHTSKNLITPRKIIYDSPVGLLRGNKIIPVDSDEDESLATTIQDANTVYSMIYELEQAKHNDILPDLSEDFTLIHDMTGPRPL